MSTTVIEQHVVNKDITSALEECMRNNQFHLALLLGRLNKKDSPRYHLAMATIEKACRNISDKDGLIANEVVETEVDHDNIIRVKVMCNWCTPKQLHKLWGKMSKGNYTWNRIRMVYEGEADYYVIVNAPPPGAKFDKKKTILFRMEPRMSKNKSWGEWVNPDSSEFLFVSKHEDGHYNNIEWHLSKTWNDLRIMTFEKNPAYKGVLSTILSGKYNDPGQIKRIDFVKFLEKKGLPVHVFGTNRWDYKDYKGSLPSHCKDDSIFPYKYVFNAENHSINNYFTEKLIDGILGESLVFYSGCYNARDFIDERAYVYLHLSNFEKDYETIKKAIEEDWHSKRLPYIKAAKQKILNQLQFFPRIEKIIMADLRKASE